MPWRMMVPLTLLMTTLFLMTTASPGVPVQVGEEAPDFIVENINGTSPIILSNYRGEVVVLNFFWTG